MDIVVWLNISILPFSTFCFFNSYFLSPTNLCVIILEVGKYKEKEKQLCYILTSVPDYEQLLK